MPNNKKPRIKPDRPGIIAGSIMIDAQSLIGQEMQVVPIINLYDRADHRQSTVVVVSMLQKLIPSEDYIFD